MADTMRLRCFECGKSVSSEAPADLIVRACLTCPECIEAGTKLEKEAGARGAARERGAILKIKHPRKTSRGGEYGHGWDDALGWFREEIRKRSEDADG